MIMYEKRYSGISITYCILMGCSFWFDIINLGWSIVYIERSQVKIVFLSLKIDYV